MDSFTASTTKALTNNLKEHAMSFNKALDLLVDKLAGWLEQGVLILPNLLVAIIIIIISIFVSKLLANVLERIFKQYSKNKALSSFLITLSKVLVVFVGVLLATSVLHLDKAITSMLAGVGILGVTLGFAFQDITANFISGVAMAIKTKYPFAVGDIIKTQDIIGNVEYINLRSTSIKTFQGQTVIVPNRLIYENPITNFSFLGMRRVDLSVGVSYGEDLEKVEKVVLNAVKDIEDSIDHKPIEFFYTEFADSSINFTVRFWVKFTKQTEYLNGMHQAIKAIKKAFNENSITIPFPIRTLDFGINSPGRVLLETKAAS
jgi:small conductance mechanosensitive channel